MVTSSSFQLTWLTQVSLRIFFFYLSIMLALVPFLIHPVRGDENIFSLIFSHSDVFSILEIFKLIFRKAQNEREKNNSKAT